MSFRPTFIPTLDISKGQAVLVKQGKVYKVLGDPFEKATFLSINTHFQLVDIDAAMGTGSNKEIIKKIVKNIPCYVGGGIRTFEEANEFLNSSARRVIISTAISKELIEKIPKERLIIAFDIDQDFNVLMKGRTSKSDKDLFQMLDEYATNLEMITITFHDKEGTCDGIPMDRIKKIKEYLDQYNIKLVVAGGISNIKEIKELIDLNVIPQFGSGFWNGKFTLGDVYQCISEKILNIKSISYQDTKLIPTIVQSVDGIVLGMVFSTPETVKISVDTRIATFYSRDRNSIWFKGATSGEYHKVHHIHYCCDGTSLRFVVEGNKFCHTGSESCFGHTDPSRANLKSLQRMLKQKTETKDAKSYTKSLLSDGFKINSKILEEAEELICTTDPEEIVHESADLIYFILMYLQKHNINVQEIESELIKRRYTNVKENYDIKLKNKDKFKIGIIVNNMPKEFVFEYLEDMLEAKITKKINSERCLEYKCTNENFMIIQTKPKDVSVLINNGFLDAVVSYEDIIINYSANAEKFSINKNKTKKVSIVIACKENMTLDMLKQENKTKKLVVMSEYVKLTNDWIRKNGLIAKIVHVSGSSEGYLANDLCDMCVAVCDSGKTLVDNNLKILDTLVTTNINLFVHPNRKELLSQILNQK